MCPVRIYHLKDMQALSSNEQVVNWWTFAYIQELFHMSSDFFKTFWRAIQKLNNLQERARGLWPQVLGATRVKLRSVLFRKTKTRV